MNAILAFWLAYILTRPVGASFGDLLSQPLAYGGLGFGTVTTSYIFFAGIIATVIYMTITHDGSEPIGDGPAPQRLHRTGPIPANRPDMRPDDASDI